ncbi:hypothetical protein [Paraburkholderia sp. DGU8]|uniref:hypothetical protein n=1 Tax=Paraburkholderia sp. DGU8 TaxID=3161997 RepID=UPI0034670FF4
MSNDDTLSPKAMDEAVEGAEAHTREVLAAHARAALYERIDSLNRGFAKVISLPGNRPANVSDADVQLARTLRDQIRSARTEAALAAAEGFLRQLGVLSS